MTNFRKMLQAAAGGGGGVEELYLLGYERYGETGQGYAYWQAIPTQVPGSWASTSESWGSSFGIKTDGTLWAWGRNQSGQLGLGDVADRSSPVQVGALSDWAQVRAGQYITLAIKTDGTLWSWGSALRGALGQGNGATNKSSPVQIGALTDWAQLAFTKQHVLAVKTDGTLWAWGFNNSGELGIGNVISRSSPVQVGALSDWASVAAADSAAGYSYAVKTDGTLWSWGYNFSGELGLNDTINRSSPVQVGALTDWYKPSFYHATKTDGTLWYIGGFDTNGVAGLNTISVRRSSPTQVGSLTDWDIVSGTRAVKTDGTLWGWGASVAGELGDGFYTSRSSPVQIGTASNYVYVSYNGGTSNTRHFFAINSSAELFTAGSNQYGALGRPEGTTVGTPTPLPLSLEFSDVFLGSPALAVKPDGTLWGWGGRYGVLGTNELLNAFSPVQIGTSSDWYIARPGTDHVLAIKTDGTLWAWGQNSQGQLGLGDVNPRSSPVQVGAGSDWQSVFCGQTVTFAVKTDGTLWAWGLNGAGQLGLGDRNISRSSPVQVGALTDWGPNIVENLNAVSAIKQDGTLWSWGAGSFGVLGLGNQTFRSSPVQVGALTDWKQVSRVGQSSCAVKTDGTLWAWGRNLYGELGQENTISRSSPVQVGALTSWDAAYGTGSTVYAFRTDGTLWVWGRNENFFDAGFGFSAPASSPVQVGSGTTWSSDGVSGGNIGAIGGKFSG